MIITCGNRRLVSYRYGWKIEILAHRKKTGETYWAEDRPAYPASLAQACEMLLERVIADGQDMTIDALPGALKTAAHEIKRYMELARKAA